MNWQALVVDTLRDPAETGRQIIGWQVPRPVIYQALILVAALNALMAGVTEFIMPSPMQLPPLLANPLSFFVVIAGGLVISAHLIYWAGRALGGQGDLSDVLVLMVWLQALRALAQVVVVVLALIAPGIAALFALGVAIFGLWLLLNFIKVSLNFATLGHAAGLLVAVMAGILLGLMLLITLTGVTDLGLSNV